MENDVKRISVGDLVDQIIERKIARVTQAREDLRALKISQGLAHLMWEKTERHERGQWAIVGKKLQEMITDTQYYLNELERGHAEAQIP